MTFSPEPHSDYLEQRIEAAQEIELLLHDDDRVLDIFREKIRFGVREYNTYLHQVEQEEKQNPASAGQAAFLHDRRLRDENAGKPGEEYEWRAYDSSHSEPLTKADIRVLQKRGSDVTWKEYQLAWKERRWGHWKRRFVRTEFSAIPWLRFGWAQPGSTWDGRRFDSLADATPAYYCTLAAIHDKDSESAIPITKSVWPDDLLNRVWQALRVWRGDHATVIQAAMKAVRADLAGSLCRQGQEASVVIDIDQNHRERQPPDGTSQRTGRPSDLITLAVAVQRFQVSRSTLKRAIAEERLKS